MSTIIQRSFSSGEISPALYARVDFFKYQTGLRTCRNFFIMRHGGATTRPGTKYVGEIKDSDQEVRLQEFIFNEQQTYVLEFGDLYMRIIQNGEYVRESSKTITAINLGLETEITSAGHGYSNGDRIYLDEIVGPTELNKRYYNVYSVAANTFRIESLDGTFVDSSALDPYVSGGTSERVYEVSTIYPEGDLQTLQFAQSADVLTIVHPSHPPSQLARLGQTNWSFSTINFVPSIQPPSPITVTGGSPGTKTFRYVVTSIARDDYEESLQSAIGTITNVVDPDSTTPIDINFGIASGAQEYNVYKEINGVYGLLGVAGSGFFQDIGVTPDTSKTPPISRNPFANPGDYPSAVTYYQQRLIFANTNNEPEKVFTSRTGLFDNFTISSPLQDDDALTFTIAGRRVNEVRHLLDLNRLVIMTSAGEWTLEGNQDGVLTPSTLNVRQQTYNGANFLNPIIIGSSALYVQARGSIVRDLGYDVQVDGYQGNDLTLFSNHLFDDFSIVDWDYQQVPHSVLWCVRDDGILLGLTYIREQQVLAWTRHDFDGGEVTNVCVIPEGNEDSVYVVVKRTVNGRVTKYVERMASRNIQDIKDYTGLDSFVSYDGRNTSAVTITLSGSLNWEYTEQLTITRSASGFTADDIGSEIHFPYSDDQVLRIEVEQYVSPTELIGRPKRTVPMGLRNVAITDWSLAIKELTGLEHLEGKDVSIFGDGFVVSSPYNDSYVTVSVVDGKVVLPKAYSVLHVGLPFIADMESLDIDSTRSETLIDKNKISKHIALQVEETRGLWAGPQPPKDGPLDGLQEFKIRTDEGYDSPVNLQTGIIEVNLTGRWNNNGRIFIRQVDPVPASVLSIAPAGLYPFQGGG